MAKKELAKKEVAEKEPIKQAPVKKAAVAKKVAVAKKDVAKKDVAKKDVAKKETAKSAPEVKDVAPAKKATLTLTTSEIGDHLAATFDIPKSHAKIYLAEAVAMIGKSLKKGNKVRISGLGVFQVKKRAARKGRNPNTGAPIKIKASKRVGFAVARDLKVKL